MYSTWLKACTQNTRVRIESSKVSEEAIILKMNVMTRN